MRLSRRQILLGAIAGTLVPRPALAKKPIQTLRPAPVAVQWPGHNREMPGLLGFNGSIPGPELRFRQGDQLDVRLENGLQDGALVHWHGVRAPNRMDGVSILTQEVVPPGAHYDYSFALPDAGTFWYHSHYLSYEQVGRGLFGPLIVEERDPPNVDHDITAMLADFRTTSDGMFDTDFGVMDDFSRKGRMGDLLRVFLSQKTVRQGDRVRLRLVNAAIDRVFRLDLDGIDGSVVALDGMPLESPTQLQHLIMAPAQRVDIIGFATSEITFNLTEGNTRNPIASIALSGKNPAPDRSPVTALPMHGLSEPGQITQTLELLMRGGEGDRNHGGFGTWAFNGVSGLPNKPFGQFRQGETARIVLLNPTGFAHGIHLHGHHFREISENGTFGPLRDTLLVASGETREIVCAFDNPGRWLFHCHMLSHSADGMATWIDVS
ncbi:Multicopper oxidase with three cupredoxin domains (includes cell division protein FtsP and spore coat protein CotA) [Lentibacter algarum]|uniref:Multicopper oxidase with three cupredoxin domains (Includes cell division protein FtsP and spore coat protein CotA) n=2 Tax=Lentibacter algarum TaxID=576131 RepID=A0A1H3NAE5_9RHOB|nr:Multicopper oxidase with three cupredoxin domains (includes cell division protein FtsP and spore coat protein CotA) [Lentibacter algarum]